MKAVLYLIGLTCIYGAVYAESRGETRLAWILGACVLIAGIPLPNVSRVPRTASQRLSACSRRRPATTYRRSPGSRESRQTAAPHSSP
jgi:hypothetical protein